MANGPQARPAKGQLIRDFTLTSTLGQPISLSDYRGRSNLVLVFAAGGDGSPDLKILAEIAADYARFLDEQTQVLAIMQCTQARDGSWRKCYNQEATPGHLVFKNERPLYPSLELQSTECRRTWSRNRTDVLTYHTPPRCVYRCPSAGNGGLVASPDCCR
jgi:hypothetical protein